MNDVIEDTESIFSTIFQFIDELVPNFTIMFNQIGNSSITDKILLGVRFFTVIYVLTRIFYKIIVKKNTTYNIGILSKIIISILLVIYLMGKTAYSLWNRNNDVDDSTDELCE